MARPPRPIRRTIRLRRAVQLALLAFFVVTVAQATFPFSPWVPPELFLWLDPLAGGAAMLAGREFIPWFLLGAGVLALAFLLGRSFCGWVCPLGTVIDISDRFLAVPHARGGRRWRPLKSVALVLFGAAALAGSQHAWLLDPLPLLWRTFGSVVLPGLTWGINSLADLLLEAGVRAPWVLDLFDWISLHLLPLEAVAVRGALVVGGTLLLILGLARLSRRFWCRNLCPLGALLGLAGRRAPLRRVVDRQECTACGLCSRDCKMGAIEADFVTTERAECILCLNCGDACKVGGTHFRFLRPTAPATTPDLTRRRLAGGLAAGALLGAGLPLLVPPQARGEHAVRPPGAREEERFNDLCIRCNECVRICSATGRCLQPALLETGMLGIWSPVADFETGYCEYTCNLCGQICPTGAIAPLPLDRKQRIPMGLAVINEETCLPFAEKQNCVVCEEHCPTPEKAIVFERVVERVQGRELVLDRPKVLEDLCIGCGICEQKCPVRAGAQGAPAGPADGAAREGGGGSAYGGASGYGEASGYGDGEPEGRGGPGERTAREAPSFPTHPHAAIRVRRTGEERIAGR